MMTLEEAIKHCKDVALSCTNKECALEHFQLLKWLQEYSNILKKQGEKKQDEHTTDKVESKFHEGDWIVYNNDICQIVKREEGCNKLVIVFGIEKELVNERNLSTARLWTIEDAKDGDVLTVDNVIFIYERTLAKHIVSYCKLINDIFEPSVDARTCCEGNTYVHPATKEQRDLLFQKMKESGYEWDAEKKELKKIEEEEYNGEDYGIDSLYHAQRILEKTLGKVDGYQSDDGILEHKCAITAIKKLYEQKPAWSEEDDKMLNDILMCGERHCYLDAGNIAWLKSLKDRVQPQPKQEWSEEDEKRYISLHNAIYVTQDCAVDSNKKKELSDFLDSLKNRVQQQSMQEWSEEDKKCTRLSTDIIDSALRAGFCVQIDRDRCVNWLKSLRPQNTWLPSDEQMNAFDAVLVYNPPCSNECRNHLITLYNDLKKLKEK